MIPFRDRVQLLVDRIFYKDRKDYRSILQDFSRALTDILDLRVFWRCWWSACKMCCMRSG
jgi:hypothetical protein